MIFCPEKYIVKRPNVNAEFLKLTGELSDHDSKVGLAKFLRANLGFTVELLTGIKLAGYQELILKSWFLRNFNLNVLGRGCSKTFLAAIFCFLYPIFNPGVKIIIAGPNFRVARNIFLELEKMINSKGGLLLQQVFTDTPSHKNDIYSYKVNDGSVVALPLSEKIRGFRAHVLIVDELLLMEKRILDEVLLPFLTANDSIKERQNLAEFEDELIAAGAMTEAERTFYGNNHKLIGLSSASYTFENLYEMYKEYSANIFEDKPLDRESPTYFVAQMSWEAIPSYLLSKTVIEAAQSGGASHSAFQREYCAQFADSSDSYYSAAKMALCTIPVGDFPHLALNGEKDKQYILSIDPSFSNSKSSDNFAMCVVELDSVKKEITVVHNYARAGGDLRDHIAYFNYLTKEFNIVMICIDNADGNFIQAANESEFLKNRKVEYKIMEKVDSTLEGPEYDKMIRESRMEYNLTDGKICFKQFFNSGDFLRKSNEYLQAAIDYKRIWFGSKIRPSSNIFDKVINSRVPLAEITVKGEIETMGDLIDNCDILIDMLKRELSLIEIKTSIKGNISYDLPSHLKHDSRAEKARRDSYTALILCAWASRIYFDIMAAPKESEHHSFTPRLVGPK